MNVQRFIKKNASTILACVGAAGVVSTAVLAVKATPKAMSLLDDAIEEKGGDPFSIMRKAYQINKTINK